MQRITRYPLLIKNVREAVLNCGNFHRMIREIIARYISLILHYLYDFYLSQSLWCLKYVCVDSGEHPSSSRRSRTPAGGSRAGRGVVLAGQRGREGERKLRSAGMDPEPCAV